MIVRQGVVDDFASAAAAYEVAVAENAELVGNGRPVDPGRRSEITDAQLGGAERDQDVETGGIPEDGEEPGDLRRWRRGAKTRASLPNCRRMQARRIGVELVRSRG